VMVACNKSACMHMSTKSVVYNWGLGSLGQLGHERFDKEATFFGDDVYIQDTPRRLVNSSSIKKIACGVGYTIAATNDKKLLAWGTKYPGNIPKEELMTPRLIHTDFEVVDVAAGKSHCAVIDSEGKVYTWGHNGTRMGGGGHLGIDNGYEFIDSPSLVSALHEASVKVDAVSCGALHTLFFNKEKGEVWSCGAIEYGRLGTGANWNDQDALTPQLIQDSFEGEKVVQVSAGYNHSIGLTESGRIFCWGRNDQGQLGLGDSFIDMYSMEDMPRLLESSKLDGKRVVRVSAGKGTSAALTDDGKIFHWGHKIMHEPMEVPVEETDDKPVKVLMAGDSSKGGTTTAWLTESGRLHTYGPYSSHLRGKTNPNPPIWKFYAKKENDSTLVTIGGNRKVFDVFGGFGQHMAARVSPVDTENESNTL